MNTEKHIRPLTEKQKNILEFIVNYNKKAIPSYREIAEHFKVSISAISLHLMALERKGYLRRGNKKHNGIVINQDKI